MSIDELAVLYQTSKESCYINDLYIRVSKNWHKYKFRDAKRTFSNEHDVLATYDDAFLKALDKFDPEKGRFIPLLHRTICNMLTDLRRRNLLVKSHEVDFYIKSEDGNPNDFDIESIEDEKIDKEAGIKSQKERDQRQLISHLVSSAKDDVTNTIVELFDSYDSFNALGKALGIHHEVVKRKITRLSRYYDANRFGDLHDYLAV